MSKENTKNFTVVAHFEIRERLAKGGMGSLYLAWDRSEERMVVLKFLARALCADNAMVERFRREAKATAHLEHPNVVKVFFRGVYQSRPYFAMEYIKGQSLAEVGKKGALEPEVCVDYMMQSARGLHAAYERGQIHRDVKPANLLLGDDGIVRVVDFGLTKDLADDSGLTATDVIIGTPSFVSPEQGRGYKCDCRSDIYSLGASFYYLLTGTLPFEATSPMDVLIKHISSPLPPLHTRRQGLPNEICDTIEKMMAKKREERFGSYDELIHHLAAMPKQVMRKKLKRRRPAADTTDEKTRLSKRKRGSSSSSSMELPKEKKSDSLRDDSGLGPPGQPPIAEPPPLEKTAPHTVKVKRPNETWQLLGYTFGGIFCLALLLFLVEGQKPKPAPVTRKPTVVATPTATIKTEPATGAVFLKTSPPGAAIALDGKETGKKANDAVLDKVGVGLREFTLSLPFHKSVTISLDVSRGSLLQPETIVLPPNWGSLEVRGQPQGTSLKVVPLDGQAPPKDELLIGAKLPQLLAGRYRLIANREGYEEQMREVVVPPDGGLSLVRFSLNRKPPRALPTEKPVEVGPPDITPVVSTLKIVTQASAETPIPPCSMDVVGNAIKNSIEMRLCYIPKGKFYLGKDKGAPEERPRHLITFKEGFWMGVCEVTQGEFVRVMGQRKDIPYCPTQAKFPITHLSWKAAVAFCKELTVSEHKQGFLHKDWCYCLPSESQWEYACRAGCKQMPLKDFAWYGEHPPATPQAVGLKKANAWGLHDTLGNVWEFCQDVWHGDYSDGPTDGTARKGAGPFRVRRGGDIERNPFYCRPGFRLQAHRGAYDQKSGRGLNEAGSRLTGFRVILQKRDGK